MHMNVPLQKLLGSIYRVLQIEMRGTLLTFNFHNNDLNFNRVSLCLTIVFRGRGGGGGGGYRNDYSGRRDDYNGRSGAPRERNRDWENPRDEYRG